MQRTTWQWLSRQLARNGFQWERRSGRIFVEPTWPVLSLWMFSVSKHQGSLWFKQVPPSCRFMVIGADGPPLKYARFVPKRLALFKEARYARDLRVGQVKSLIQAVLVHGGGQYADVWIVQQEGPVIIYATHDDEVIVDVPLMTSVPLCTS